MDTSGEPLLNGKIQKWATFEKGGMKIAVLGYTNVDESKWMTSVTKNLKFYDHVCCFSSSLLRWCCVLHIDPAGKFTWVHNEHCLQMQRIASIHTMFTAAGYDIQCCIGAAQ